MRAVYLHGFLGDPAVWGPDVDAIALPGHGGGPVWPTWRDNLSAIAAGIGEADLVIGYSLGARVALGLVAERYIARAILISVNPGIPPAERAARRASDAAWAQHARTDFGAFLDAWEAQPLFATQPRVPAELRAERRARRLRHVPDQIARSLEVMGLAEMPDYRGAITAERTALIVGEDDPKYVGIARAYPVPCSVITGAGHDPTLEQPEALAAAIATLRQGTWMAP